MPYSHAPDARLLDLVAQRDTEALASLYDRYAPALYGVILRLVRDEGVASDLLEESFWQVWVQAGHGPRPASVPAYLLRLAREQSLDHLRRRPVQAGETCLPTALRERA